MIQPSELIVDEGWRKLLEPAYQSDSFSALNAFLNDCFNAGLEIYPPPDKVFAAYNLTPFDRTRVVILGQDPYHSQGQAMGLSFSVPRGVKNPPSLANILKEIEADIGGSVIDNGDLTPWARQGVLLLNTVLTVEKGKPGAHAKIGWEAFTDRAIAELSAKREGLVFLLWGAFAQKKEKFIDVNRHLVLRAAHPSPLSAHRGFFGCRHFSKANAFIEDRGGEKVLW